MASATGSLVAPSPLSHAPSVGWLRNAQFDITLIVVVALWALAAGTAIVIQPSLFWPILFLDVWLLGYTHVISTFTRLAFDRESFETIGYAHVTKPDHAPEESRERVARRPRAR